MFQKLLDLLFPPRCVSCEAFGSWWCTGCQDRVEMPTDKMVDGLNGFVALGMYHDPLLRTAIHGLKYHGGTCLMPEIFRFAEQRLFETDVPWQAEAKIAIQALPTDRFRERERGFDQAVLLRDALKDVLHPSASCVMCIERTERRTAQAGIADPLLRRANAREMFRVRSDVVVSPVILLIDDVTTTGSTMTAAAEVLRSAGCERVYGFALAIGE